MAKQDFSEYEKRRAAHHEELWRAAGSLGCARDKKSCQLRLCRRLLICSGPMVPSAHQAGAVRAQQAIGLSGEACATLPLCIANSEPWVYAIRRKTMEKLQKISAGGLGMSLIGACVHAASKRRFRPRRS